MRSRSHLLPWLLIILISLLVVLFILRLQNRVQVLAVHPGPGEQVSSNGRFGVTFNQPMDALSVEVRFTIHPSLEGSLAWDGSTLWFTPLQQLDRSQVYQVTISAGAQSIDGRKLWKAITWQASVREPALLYLVLDSDGGDLFRFDFDTGQSASLTQSANAVIDFAPSPSGDLIAYTQRNAIGGYDLWLTDRDGVHPQMLLECDADRCSQPAWSVDEKWIAYDRESFQPGEKRYLPSRVWTLDTASGETAPLYQEPQAYGHSPSFSPDGERLAIYDTVNNAIRILELRTSQQSAISTVYPGVGDWSPDGEELIFVDLAAGILEPNVAIYIVNFAHQELLPAPGSVIHHMDFDPPQWSPDGEWIAYAARPVDSSVNKSIWVKNLTERDPLMLTDDPSATFVAYRWDPRGERLAFQRYPHSGSTSHASIWIWERSTGQTRLLIENGARPEWLP
ncbi:MAG: Ig-like domain-containing protein [Brevefilum fermentans]|jgi:Tol biopolymer transport system component